MAHLYYREGLTAAELRPGQNVTIEGEEARHALRVARLRVSESTLIGNGAGVLAECEVVEADRDRFTARVLTVCDVAVESVRFTLVQALAKGDRDERAVEQATEFGVNVIVPWQADRSVSRWNGDPQKQRRGVQRWQKTAREASKQSLRAHIPTVEDLSDISQLCELASEPATAMFVLHPAAETRLPTQLPDAQRLVLVVGPEGGLSEREISALEAAGATAVQLGDTVLRTSSAGPAALAVLNARLGRW